MILGLSVYGNGLSRVHDVKKCGFFGIESALVLLDLVTKVLSCRVGMVTLRDR